MYYVHFIISLLYLCARLLLHYCVSIGEWRICLFTENRAYVTTYTENRITTPRRNEILSYFEDPCIDNIGSSKQVKYSMHIVWRQTKCFKYRKIYKMRFRLTVIYCQVGFSKAGGFTWKVRVDNFKSYHSAPTCRNQPRAFFFSGIKKK